MNVLIASGHLGSDPDTRYTRTGSAVTNFSLPVTQGWGENKKTTWVKCVLWGKKGTGDPHGLVPYLAKGKLVTVQGEIVLNEFTNGQGVKTASLECIVRDLVVPKDSSAPPEAAQRTEEEVGRFADAGDFDDDIPF